MIIDEKCMSQQPPPPYITSNGPAMPPPPFPNHRGRLGRPTLSALPSHILLQIVYMTFPQTPGRDEGRLERQRKTLYWLSVGLRLVNRVFFTACMHVLRSTYLPAYDSLIRSPYSSDPFPLPSASSPSHAPSYSSQPLLEPIQTIQRETTVLDLFIALKVREDVWMDDSELHLEREESFKDLFDLNQPRSRLEDLVRVYGVREGVISVAPYSSGANSTRRSTNSSRRPPPIPFSTLSVSFSSRRVGLVLVSQGRKRTIVEVSRTREERLEVAAKKLAKELGVWLKGSGSVYGHA